MPARVKLAGRHLALAVALTMVVGLGVASAASAATKVPIWSTSGTTPLTYGTEVSFSGTSVHGMNLKWISGGVHFYIECNTLSANGKVENYASGKPGTLTPATAKFQGCRVVEVGLEETTCTVPSEIPFSYKSGELTNTPYSNGGLKLSEVLIKLKVSGCPHGAYENLQWEFWGSTTGTESTGSWPGEIRFPEGTSLSMNAGGTGAVIEFAENIQQGGSTPVKVIEEEIIEPHTPGHRYWYKGGGMRRGEGPRTLVAAGSPVAVQGAGDTLTIEGKTSGIQVKVACSNGSTSGSVENPSGGADGVATLQPTLTGCEAVKPEGISCTVEGGVVHVESLTGGLVTTKSGPLLQMTGPNEKLARFALTGCTKKPEVLNKSYEMLGRLFFSENGIVPWSLAKSLNEEWLSIWGNPAYVSGSIAAETSGHEMISWTE